MAKPKKRVVLTTKTAIARLDQMLELLNRDVRLALDIEASLEEGNKIVVAELQGVNVQGARCQQTLHLNGLMHLALVLARLFDRTPQEYLLVARRDPKRSANPKKHPNRSDIASIPMLSMLLRQKRCRAELVRRARDWTPQMPDLETSNVAACERAIDDALASYGRLRATPAGRSAMRSLSEFRNKELAHSLVGKAARFRPKIRDLLLLVEVGRDVIEQARLAIDGHHLNLSEIQRISHKDALAFWRPAFDGIKAAAH